MLLRFLVLIVTVVVARAAETDAVLPIPLTAKERIQGYRDTRLLAKPKLGTEAQADAAEDREGRTRHRTFGRFGGLRTLAPAASESVEEAIERLRATGRYEFVEADRIVHAMTEPNDPSFSQQWSLRNTGQSSGTAGADIGAVSGWDTTRLAPQVIVAVIDSGARLTHADLAGNLWTNPSPSTTGYSNDLHGIDATVGRTSTRSGNPTDSNGHGTHVSGIIGAVGNNGTGTAGVAWKVQLMPLKFLAADGSGSTSDEIECIDYAIARGAHIINASFGSSTYSAAELAAIQSARAAGIIIVAAAGNDGANLDAGSSYPASYAVDNIVTVASTGRTDALSSFSNYGSGLVDLAAPGESILSTYATSDTTYQSLSGTSMAAPHVTGALALLRARYPTDTYRQLINRLLRSTTPIGSLAGKVQTAGRLNLAAALASTDSRPLNDDFARRVRLEGSTLRVRASSSGASAESGEPAHAGLAAAGSLWWTWTAPATASVVFDTTGSAYEASICLYTGESLDRLTAVASGTTRLTWAVTAGTAYQLAVDTRAGGSGLTTLKIATLPANDTFAQALTLSGTSMKVQGTTTNATTETGDPTFTGLSTSHSVWYTWTAPRSGSFQLAAFSDEADMVAAVFTGPSLSSLTVVAANNNASTSNSDSLLTFNAVAGTRYTVLVNTLGTSVGNFILTLTDSVWQYPTGAELTSSPAVSAGGHVIFGSNDGAVYALNADGTLKWRAATGDAIDLASPAIGADGTVYLGSTDGFLYALDGTTGSRKWRLTAASALSASPAVAPDGTVYVRDDTTLYAISTNGTPVRKWSFPLPGGTYSSPAVGAQGTVYVGATGGTLYAIAPDGTQRWVFTGDSDIYTSPAIGADGSIYFASLNGTVYALTSSGSLRWSWSTGSTQGGITSSLALGGDGTLYFGTYDHQLRALSDSGVLKWSFALGDECRASSPAVAADGTVYIGAYDGLIYAVSSQGQLVRTYPSAARIRSSPVIAQNRLYFTSGDAKAYAFAIGTGAASSAWPMARQNALHTAAAPAAVTSIAPTLTALTAVSGQSFTLTVTATDTGTTLSYQWYKDGIVLAGATSPTYTVSSATTADAGTYTVAVSGSSGVITPPATLVVVEAARVGGLIGLSTRALGGTGSQTLIVGFTVAGGDKRVLVRGVGPTLTDFGVAGALNDPHLALFSATGTLLAANDNWGGTSELSTAFSSAGEFPLPAASKDAALVSTLAPGSYTAHIAPATGEPGVALAEIYDLATLASGRLSNLSTRAQVGTGGDVLIVGFVVSGNLPKTLLIRGIGPALTAFGIAGALADPKVEVFRENARIDQNDNWGGDTRLAAAFSQVGAFSLTDTSSRDAALIVTLPPGNYTAQVSGVGGTTGTALAEVYELP